MDATFSYLNSILFVFLENACNAYILLATKVVQVVNVVVFLNQSLNNLNIFGHCLVHIWSDPVSLLKVVQYSINPLNKGPLKIGQEMLEITTSLSSFS